MFRGFALTDVGICDHVGGRHVLWCALVALVHVNASYRWIQERGGEYCAISINSAGPVTRDSPAEILVSARRQNGRDSMFFLAHMEDFCGIYVEIVLLS